MAIVREGQQKRIWTPEQKSEIAHKYLADHISARTIEIKFNADRSIICRWVKKDIAEGDSTFIPDGQVSNPFAALHISKNLSEFERLRLMVTTLKIENEQLKRIWV